MCKKREITVMKGHELFDNDAYRIYIDKWGETYSTADTSVKFSSEHISEVSQKYLEKEISPRMLDRLYSGEAIQLHPDRINALERTIENALGVSEVNLNFRKNLRKSVSKPKVLLTDIQTINLIKLHLNSVAFLIIEQVKIVLYSTENPDFSAFQAAIKTAINKSRKNCKVFESSTIGNINDFFIENYDDIVDKSIEDGFKLILRKEKEKSIILQEAVSKVREIQDNLLSEVEKRINSLL